MKILAFEIEVGGVKSIVNDLGTLKTAIKETNDELKVGPEIGSREYNKLQKQLGALKEIQKQVSAETRTQGREFVKNADQGKRSYRALNAELVNLRAQFKELSEADRRSSIGKGIIKNIQVLDKELKEIDSTIGLFQRNVGNYRQALIGLGDIVTGGLITGGLQNLFREVSQFGKEAIQVTADFGRQMGILGQVSGAAFQTIQVEGRGAVNALQLLEEQALSLGNSTEFTASQVADLEIAYAKLGFTPVEILALLSDTIDTATVSGSELGRTAEVIGGTLRAFNLDASEGSRVADVLAKSFASSSLNLTKYEVALATVGASGAAVGLTLEDVVSTLATLTDAKVEASTAATSLRNIFIENAKEGITLDEALRNVRESTNQLVTANEEYGKRGAVQAVILANQTEKTAALNAVLNESVGFSKASAAAIRDDLQGSLDSVTSATEGLQLALVGTFGEGLQSVISGFADFIRGLTSIVSGTGEWAEKLDNVTAFIKNMIPGLLILTGVIASANAEIIFQALVAIPSQIAALGRSILATTLFTAANKLLNATLRLNPVGLIVSAIALLIGGLISAYQQSEKFRASIAGLGAVASEIFNIIKEAVGNFVEGFNQLKEGNISAGLKLFGQGIVKANPIGIAFTQGERLKDAFNSGYDKSIVAEGSADAVTAEMEATGEAGEKAGEEAGTKTGDGLTKGLNESTGRSLADLKKRKKELQKEFETLDPGTAQFNKVSSEIRSINAEISTLKDSVKSVDTPGAFNQLNSSLSDLKSKIQDAIVTGTDYSDLLGKYQELSDDAARAQDEFKNSVDVFIVSSRLAEDSISFLSSEVKILKSELDDATPGNLQALTDELVVAETKLQDAKNEIERAKLISSGGPSTGVLAIDIQEDIDSINTVRQVHLAALNDAELDEQEFANRRKAVNAEADIAILGQRLSLFKEGTEERLKLEDELAQQRRQLEGLGVESTLSSEILDIEKSRDARILAIDRVGQSEKQFQLERKILDQQTTVAILQTRLDLDKLSGQERLALQVQLADAEVDLEKSKNAQILDNRRLLSEESTTVVQFALQTLSSLATNVGNLQNSITQRRLNDVTDFYENEIMLAEGNDERILELERERDEEVEKIQREQFERNKKLEIANAIISGAQAVLTAIKTFGPPPSPLGIAAIAAAGIITALQIATIASASFHEGGFTGPAIGKRDESGHVVKGSVHDNEYVTPTRVLKTREGKFYVDQLEKMRRGISTSRIFKLYSGDNGVTGGFAAPSIQPNVPAPTQSGYGISVANMSEESIDLLAGRVAERVGESVKAGVIDGMNNNNRMHERKQAMTKRSNI